MLWLCNNNNIFLLKVDVMQFKTLLAGSKKDDEVKRRNTTK